MKKRTLKKLVTTMAIGVLFSTTLVFGSEGRPDFDFSMSPSQVAYTDYLTKRGTTRYAVVEQTALDTVMEYKVVDSLYQAKCSGEKISGARTEELYYYSVSDGETIVGRGSYLSLRIYNNPADNMGRVRPAEGRWTP